MIFSLGTGKETEEPNLLQQLSDACLVVDALEPSVREELVKKICNKELTSYRQIFEGAGFLLSLIFLVCCPLKVSIF
jgi:vacuolar protein sorting-associated protein 53